MAARTAIDNYADLPLSKLTLEGSGFNINDIKIMKVIQDRSDDVTERRIKASEELLKKYISTTYELHAALIIGEVKKLLSEHKLEIKDMLDTFKQEMLIIMDDLTDKVADLKAEIKGINIRAKELAQKVEITEGRINSIEKLLKISA